jgi:hypothetical protein
MKLKDFKKGQVVLYFKNNEIHQTTVKNITQKGSVRLDNGTLLKNNWDTDKYDLYPRQEWIEEIEKHKKLQETRALAKDLRKKAESLNFYYAHLKTKEELVEATKLVDKLSKLGFTRCQY